MVPFDTRSPFQTSGIRIGTPAVTTRGLKEADMTHIAAFVDRVLSHADNAQELASVRNDVRQMMHARPLFN
jgi:glycine hydroxymethyltransferase